MANIAGTSTDISEAERIDLLADILLEIVLEESQDAAAS
jgi:hypothetical protein